MLVEGSAFALAAASYLYLQSQSSAWPPHGDHLPALLWSTIFTIGLVASELPNLWLSRKARQKDERLVRLGALFMTLVGALLLVARCVRARPPQHPLGVRRVRLGGVAADGAAHVARRRRTSARRPSSRCGCTRTRSATTSSPTSRTTATTGRSSCSRGCRSTGCSTGCRGGCRDDGRPAARAARARVGRAADAAARVVRLRDRTRDGAPAATARRSARGSASRWGATSIVACGVAVMPRATGRARRRRPHAVAALARRARADRRRHLRARDRVPDRGRRDHPVMRTLIACALAVVACDAVAHDLGAVADRDAGLDARRRRRRAARRRDRPVRDRLVAPRAPIDARHPRAATPGASRSSADGRCSRSR